MPGHTKCCTCHAKSSQQTWRSEAPKCNPSQEISAPYLPTDLMNMSLVLRLPRKMHFCRSSSNVPHLPSFLEMPQNPHLFTHFWQGAQSLAPATRHDIWTSKSDISTSKSGPNLVCFLLFDFETCFAPQRRALFRHLNFQKWSEPGVFSIFWLWNVLRATTACTFSTAQLPKVLRTWCAFYFLTLKCASRHNGVQFFISHLARWLRTRRFSEPTFRPSGATNHLLSDSSHLCFSSVHVVGSLTSKLPSIIKLNLKHHKACQQSHFASGHSPCHSFGSCIIAFFVLKNVANFRQENKSCPPWSLDLTTLVKESDSAVPLCSDITCTNPPTDSPANATPYCSIVSRLCSSVRQPKVN